eukprot:scaffold8060_cov444-Prasinococcus_capsulatus_cf.AAC.3
MTDPAGTPAPVSGKGGPKRTEVPPRQQVVSTSVKTGLCLLLVLCGASTYLFFAADNGMTVYTERDRVAAHSSTSDHFLEHMQVQCCRGRGCNRDRGCCQARTGRSCSCRTEGQGSATARRGVRGAGSQQTQARVAAGRQQQGSATQIHHLLTKHVRWLQESRRKPTDAPRLRRMMDLARLRAQERTVNEVAALVKKDSVITVYKYVSPFLVIGLPTSWGTNAN